MPSEEPCHSTELSIDPIQSNLGRRFDQNEWKSEQKHHHSSKQISSHQTSHQGCSHLKFSYGIKPDVGHPASKILGHQRNDNHEGQNTILHDMQTDQQANVSTMTIFLTCRTRLCWTSSHQTKERFNFSSREALDLSLHLCINTWSTFGDCE